MNIKAQLQAAHKTLEAAGWTKVCSVMSDSNSNGRYGSLYTKNGESFYLNIETLNNLPE